MFDYEMMKVKNQSKCDGEYPKVRERRMDVAEEQHRGREKIK